MGRAEDWRIGLIRADCVVEGAAVLDLRGFATLGLTVVLKTVHL